MVCLEPLVPCAAGAIIHAIRLGQDAAIGVHSNNLQTRNLLLQLESSSSDGASGSSRHNHVVELSLCLLIDLLRSTFVVRQGVSRVLVLIQHVATQILGQALRQEDVRVLGIPRRLCWRSQDFSAQALHCVDLLSGHLLWQADDHLVALDGSCHAKTNASVSTGGLNENVARLNAAALLGFLDHALANSIFDGTTSVEELALRNELALHIQVLLQA
mmetsp:Transcript_1598/g.2805  ORF Transcript_1598/g.2805 Transcript_1598/m.2805 type:complete len:216 (+) Transcript_1598:509-1156(+)